MNENQSEKKARKYSLASRQQSLQNRYLLEKDSEPEHEFVMFGETAV